MNTLFISSTQHIRSFLRPAPANAYVDNESLVLRDDKTGYTREIGTGITLSGLGGAYMDPVIFAQCSVTFLGNSATEKLKNMTNVCLMRY